MKKQFDVIVIGSGVGGSTFADYLTRRFPGIDLAILESGPYLTRKHFTQKEMQMSGLYYNRGSMLSSNMHIGVAAANTLGGSSAVYTGVSFRPPEKVVTEWRGKYGLSFLDPDFVDRSLTEIEAELNVNELPESFDNDNNRLFRKGAEALNIPVKRLKINIKNCQQQGFCNLGCTSGAKQGALEVQIPKLVQAGVTIFCNTRVTAITKTGVKVWVSKANWGEQTDGLEPGEHFIMAGKIILAAGALHSPALLLNSSRDLDISNINIGRYLTLHPAYNVNAVYSQKITNYQGFPKTVYSDYFSESDRFYLETSFYFPGVTAKNQPGYGAMHAEFMKAYDQMMSILILVHDEARPENRIATDRKGRMLIHYTVSDKVKHSMAKALQVAVQLFFAAGCTRALIPGSQKWPIKRSDLTKLNQLITTKSLNFARNPLSSAHPQGGARMGRNPDEAVCDPSGQVYGTENVYVADASLFPTSVHVNPYETVMLLAKHVAESIQI